MGATELSKNKRCYSIGEPDRVEAGETPQETMAESEARFVKLRIAKWSVRLKKCNVIMKAAIIIEQSRCKEEEDYFKAICLSVFTNYYNTKINYFCII